MKNVEEVLKFYYQNNFDTLIAISGGSAMGFGAFSHYKSIVDKKTWLESENKNIIKVEGKK